MADPTRQRNGPVPAAGWIKELALRPDGIRGRVEWTKTARKMIAACEYRCVSPVFTRTKDGQLIRIKGAGLVHEPNLELTALSNRKRRPLTKKTDAAAALEERKIDTDPEQRAFIRARVDPMTYPELAAAVADAFPPDRRIGKSAIHAWWKRERST